jgi:hypothetical protein
MGIKIIVIGAFVDPRPIGHERRVVPLFEGHRADEGIEILPPRLVGGGRVLPARDLIEDEEADLIAMLQEGLAIGIVGGADDVATEFPL